MVAFIDFCLQRCQKHKNTIKLKGERLQKNLLSLLKIIVCNSVFFAKCKNQQLLEQKPEAAEKLFHCSHRRAAGSSPQCCQKLRPLSCPEQRASQSAPPSGRCPLSCSSHQGCLAAKSNERRRTGSQKRGESGGKSDKRRDER